jgi:hypothetical protein
MRTISLNARLAHDDIGSAEVEVVLFHITHPLLDAPVRLSTDPTARLSLEPLRYGTRSSWLTEDDSPFLFVLAAAQLPDDKKDAPAAARLVLANLDNSIAGLLRSFTDPATVDLAVVLSSSPDLVEMEVLGLETTSSEGAGDQVTISLSRDLLTSEPWPSARTTRSRFPGLWP